SEQAPSFLRILLDALAVLVERRQRVLGFRIALLGASLEQFCSASEILSELLAFHVQEAEVVGGGGVAEFSGGGKQPWSLRAVMQAAAARHVEDGECEHGIGVTPLGRKLVPFHGLGIVERHAKAVGIKLPKEGHGMRVALF